ncbi:MAG: hypothetical protein HY473_02485, partial [Candidatus Sungbacteria bacterium]|nr:hypothetical protein [Candidatus Sungbacteria bacterium]
MYRNKHTQSIATRVLLILAVAVFAFTATVQPSHAILGVGDVSITAGDIPRTLFQIFDRILSAVGSRAYHQALRSVTYR